MRQCQITTIFDFGRIVRAVRKTNGVRHCDIDGNAGMSHVHMRDLEHGKETAQIGLALQVLS